MIEIERAKLNIAYLASKGSKSSIVVDLKSAMSIFHSALTVMT